MKREDLIEEFFVKGNFRVGAEIGSFKGEFAEEILKRWGGDLYMVDVWRRLDYDDYPDGSNHSEFERSSIMIECAERMEPFGERSTMIRAFSNRAYKLFPDECLDFVFIDANHTYDSVCEDMRLWYPKVRKGGIFMGHDYINIDWTEGTFLENGKDKHIYDNIHKWYCGVFGVNPAVDEFCKERGYQPSITDEWFGTWFFEKK